MLSFSWSDCTQKKDYNIIFVYIKIGSGTVSWPIRICLLYITHIKTIWNYCEVMMIVQGFVHIPGRIRNKYDTVWILKTFHCPFRNLCPKVIEMMLPWFAFSGIPY